MRTAKLNLLVVAISMAVVPLAAQASKAGKSTDSRVKLYTDAIEVVDVQSGSTKCADSKNGITVRFKVASTSPVDVRLVITGAQFPGVMKEFADQQPGTELSDYMCLSKPEYKVYTRPAGSNQPWPKK